MTRQLPAAARRVVAILGEHTEGLTAREVTAAVQAAAGNVPAARVAQLLAAAITAGHVTLDRDARYRATGPAGSADERETGRMRELRRLRAVIVDVESVVHTTAVEPYTDKRLYQIGAARTGADTAWVAAAPTWSAWVTLPDDTWEIRSPAARAAHAAGHMPPAAALTALSDYLGDADVVVAYNGAEADFPLLAESCTREGLPPLGGVYIDAYYLALSVWPASVSHRLAVLAADAGVDTTDLSWHDAADDCVLLARVLEAAADVVAAWPADLANLVASVAPDSHGWLLLRELAAARTGRGPAPVGTVAGHRHAHAAAVVTGHLAAHPPRRGTPGTPPPGRGALPVPDSVRGTDGKVSATLLARAVHGGNAAPRAAQVTMTETLHAWAADGTGGLLEAPTGTGKSLAVLAAALDWLAGDDTRCAVISTYTKQLQAQLAHDVAALAGAVPGILQATDVVKGMGNRLSLRGLVAACADATWVEAGGRRRPENRFVEQREFRELLVYLLLRLVAATGRLEGWAAHSVDPVDVPLFFTAHARGALQVWLDSLSQAANGEYAPDAAGAAPLAVHTDEVSEALAAHRLVLANHALLMANTATLAELGPQTLLFVDEAHQLEDAATGALTTELDYRAVEDLLGDLRAWLADNAAVHEADKVHGPVGGLTRLLDHENLPRVAAMAFDARSAGVGTLVGSRTVTLASAYAGTAGVPQVRSLTGSVSKLAGVCTAVSGALWAFHKARAGGMDFFDAERVAALAARAGKVAESAARIVDDIDAVYGDRPAGADVDADSRAADTSDGPDANETDPDGDVGSAAEPDGAAEPGEDGTGLGDPELDDEAVDDTDAGGAGHAPLPNQVVYATETEPLRGGLRYYRFTLATSPIELSAEARWNEFIDQFSRTYYVSATLRVSGGWDYIRTRLGLPDHLPALALDTPFDMAEQAELVCLSDFPSWAEQSDGAMRTVAHQLAGYTRELVDPAGATEGPDSPPAAEGARGGYDGGAMVLTTSRSAAGGIADHLAGELGRRGIDVPLHSAIVLGNPRAVVTFTDAAAGGGLLVGTRGLWQGVDVADEHRLRLVWVNKLPFAPFADPVVEARRAAVTAHAEAAGADDPDQVATETYYLPLAALGLRQAVGRMIRSERHRGVIVISDRKLAGQTALRRSYRQVFLGSLDPGLLKPDPDTGEPAGGNVTTMADGWARIWAFYARHGLITAQRAVELSAPDALAEHTLLPQTRRIRSLAMTEADVAAHRAAGTLGAEVSARAAQVGGLLRLSDIPAELKPSQAEVISAVAAGRNVLGLLPTGFGKSFCFQLPALVLPGVTLVVSPLVALMHDQALELNASIGGAVRALVSPLRESSSRAGKTEVADQLLGRADHGIRLVYVSPERLCQRRFRELVRDAVAAGRVSRMALDEAHTFVQWGDDFRPSFRRVEQFLAELRRDHGLAVTALTATANRTVHAGLREAVFGLPAEPPEAGDGDALVTVTENPIRPELAVFRRSLTTAGPQLVAGLAEEVIDAVADHAIFYCLTVKEVNALTASLRAYLGEAGVRVRRFHGRLTEAEKAAVMTEFRDAPRRGEEGFAPLVVVATSAFGLGINRPDVRTVFCVSPPTDLAALYQQIGRAGRDAAGKAVTGAAAPSEDGNGDTVSDRAGIQTNTATAASDEPAGGPDGDPGSAPVAGAPAAAAPVRRANVGLTLMTSRGLRTAAWMTGQDLPAPLLRRMAAAVLACGGVLDAAWVAERLVAADLTSGNLSPEKARARYTHDSYSAGVVRAFAGLAGLDAVTDLGDFPPLAAVKPGELLTTAGADPGETAVVAALLELPARGTGPLTRSRLSISHADAHLAAAFPGYRDLAEDVAATWQLLADLHDRGLLDVSAAPSRRLVTGVAVHTGAVPAEFDAALSGKAARAGAEIAALRDFFTDRGTCANVKFANYFGVTAPPECCTTAANRCSACWDYTTGYPVTDVRPATADALDTPRPRPAGSRLDGAAKARRLDQQVASLCWLIERGLSARQLTDALRGVESWWLAKARRRITLPHAVLNSRYFGVNPAATLAEVEESCSRLAGTGRLVPVGSRWRDADNVARQLAREAKGAAKAAAAADATAPADVPAGAA